MNSGGTGFPNYSAKANVTPNTSKTAANNCVIHVGCHYTKGNIVIGNSTFVLQHNDSYGGGNYGWRTFYIKKGTAWSTNSFNALNTTIEEIPLIGV